MPYEETARWSSYLSERPAEVVEREGGRDTSDGDRREDWEDCTSPLRTVSVMVSHV